MSARRSTSLLCACLVLSGCAVTSDGWEKAEKLCESNGGVRYYYVWPTAYILCVNGARFDE